ncbi:MAG: CNNM domain-containing protein [Bacteroidales bacterium]|jgi:CBS domain containing-hemolysin-like protein|nr:CNNM domain-containing protein [Bacteroidales bacterium]MDD4057683.1 CNNM domain-containing protein [Bacteroidales bacterium]
MALGLILFLYVILKAGEIYLLTISRTESDHLSKKEGSAAESLRALLSRPDFLFGTIFQLSALFVVSASILSMTIFYRAGFFAALIITISFIIISGHILPEVLSSRIGLKMALAAGVMVRMAKWLTQPVNMILSSFAKSVENSREERDVKSVEEFEEDRGMLLNIVKLSETTVRDIMTPRVTVEALESQLSWADVKTRAVECGFSRLPVYEGTIDNVTGFLYIKDMVGFIGRENSFDWTKHIRKAYFVPGTKRINDLLEEFRQKKIHLAVVADEYGGMEGIVTLEDILEEIVGEISDETDIKENIR